MECFLMCANKTHGRIFLPDQKPVIVGRTPAIKIKDKKLSRKQIELTANYEKQNVVVRQLGLNPSTVGGISLSRHDTNTLCPGGKVNLLGSKYEHFIYFTKHDTFINEKSSKDPSTNEKLNKKRRHEPNVENNVVQLFKKQKTGDESLSQEDTKDLKAEFGDEIIEELSNSQDKSSKMVRDSGCVEFSPLVGSEWEEAESGTLLIHRTTALVPRAKIASFDLDGTLITTKSGRVFARGPDDWTIKYPPIPGKLQALHKDGFKIVIFTNQGQISKGKLKKVDFQKKMEKIASTLKVPLQVFAATNLGIYRKPMMGMWQYLIDKENHGLAVNRNESFYVGDAAGRPVNWAPKMKKDFACSDRTFAKNIGISFHTPEEFFLNKKPAAFNWPEFNPMSIDSSVALFTPTTSRLISSQQEVIIMVGYPASGKTTFVKKHLLPHGYIHVNRDNLGSWQKCVAMCQSELSRNKSVAIDNTSPDKESRQRYIEVAKKLNVPVRCFVLNTTYDHASHNNRIRELTNKDKNHKPVGRMVFNTYRSLYQEPNTSEGFQEILRVNFVPHFETTALKELYMQYTE